MAKEKEVKAKSPKNSALDMLLENSITLQKTLTDLAFSLKDLNKKISSMLELFENASQTIKEGSETGLSEKIDLLAKQNKTIAQGLLLLEKSIRKGKSSEIEEETEKIRPLPSL